MEPLVSIIIPTYNRAQYIGDALDSIMSQTYTNWECVVVDDGSTDNTELVVNAYEEKDNRIKLFKRPIDFPKGCNGARNFGISLASGTYIAFCDDDDFWLPQKLKKQVPILQKYERVGLVTCDIEFVSTDGVRSGRLIHQTGNHGYVFKELLLKNRLCMATPLLRRDVFDKVGEFNTDFTIYEDWEYWRRVSYYYEFYNVEEVLVCYRKHDKNTSLIVTDDPLEQYMRYRELTKALLKWGKNRFRPDDRTLIAKVELQRYKQLLRNHCRGLIAKLKFLVNLGSYNVKEMFHLIYLFFKFKT